MAWFPLSDELYSDPRFISLSDGAVALWTRAASWSAHRLTDGKVPASTLPLFRVLDEQLAVELVDAGVWRRVRGGFQFADWPTFASKHAVEARREADRRRQNSHRRSKPKPSRRDTGVTDTVTEPLVTPSSRDSHKRPIPSSVPNGTGAAAPPDVNAGTCVAAWVEEAEKNGFKPTSGMKAAVGRVTREMLGAGNEPARVLQASRQAGAKGYATVDRELSAMSGRNVHPIRPNATSLYDADGVMRDPKTGVAIER